jgi:hypothetical protein
VPRVAPPSGQGIQPLRSAHVRRLWPDQVMLPDVV